MPLEELAATIAEALKKTPGVSKNKKETILKILEDYQKPSFDQWLASDSGQKSNDFTTLETPGYLKNRLWWAFHAGNWPMVQRFDTKAEDLLKQVATGKRILPVGLRREIERYVNHK